MAQVIAEKTLSGKMDPVLSNFSYYVCSDQEIENIGEISFQQNVPKYGRRAGRYHETGNASAYFLLSTAVGILAQGSCIVNM